MISSQEGPRRAGQPVDFYMWREASPHADVWEYHHNVGGALTLCGDVTRRDGRWYARGVDLQTGQVVSLGSYKNRSEAKRIVQGFMMTHNAAQRSSA